MKPQLIFSMVAGALIFVTSLSAQAQPVTGKVDSAVPSLGSRTRSEIAKLSRQGADSDRALRFQEEGDRALRRGELARAAEEYGRAEESIDTLHREQNTAVGERSRAERELARARRSGVSTVRAEDELMEGNKALDDGDYVQAQIHYHEARVALATK